MQSLHAPNYHNVPERAPTYVRKAHHHLFDNAVFEKQWLRIKYKITFKYHIKVKELCISNTVHRMIKVCLKHILSVIHDLRVYFDPGFH